MQDFQAIFEEATEAATTAQDVYLAKHGEPFYCGFAWVTVKPARGPFIAWCKKQTGHEFGSSGTYGGWQFWGPGKYRGQSMDVKEEGARAFADVLKQHGLKVSVGSRAD